MKKNSGGMIDITKKKVTNRVARACCVISMDKKTLIKLIENKSPKGDVLETAKIAGIMAAKKTSDVIPMCHPLSLTKADIQFKIDERKNRITVFSEILCTGQTGVEMEALTSASVAALTIYDMMKWADKRMIISDLKLMYKSGGKSGVFKEKEIH